MKDIIRSVSAALLSINVMMCTSRLEKNNKGKIMAFNKYKLLATGTNDRAVAMNWHKNLIPKIVADIEADKAFVKMLKHGTGGEGQDHIAIFERDLKDHERILADFLEQYPLPNIVKIKDDVKISNDIPVEWNEKPLLPSRPLKPLVLRNNALTAPALIYQCVASDEVYKVVNITYNHPNRAEVIEYSF